MAQQFFTTIPVGDSAGRSRPLMASSDPAVAAAAVAAIAEQVQGEERATRPVLVTEPPEGTDPPETGA